MRCGNRTPNKLYVCEENLVVRAHVCWFSIKPTARRRIRFLLLLILIYTEQAISSKKIFLLDVIIQFWEYCRDLYISYEKKWNLSFPSIDKISDMIRILAFRNN